MFYDDNKNNLSNDNKKVYLQSRRPGQLGSNLLRIPKTATAISRYNFWEYTDWLSCFLQSVIIIWVGLVWVVFQSYLYKIFTCIENLIMVSTLLSSLCIYVQLSTCIFKFINSCCNLKLCK